jgi:hypothetical protein
MNAPCPYVRSGGDGTHWCALAEQTAHDAREADRRARQEQSGPLPQASHNSLLIDSEIDRITDAQWAQNNHQPIYAAHRAYARAVERAVLARMTAPSAEPVARERAAMRLALGHIKRAEDQPTWNGYAVCVDQARDALRAALGEE